MAESEMSDSAMGVAIIGMAGRFPGAPSIEAFWHNLRTGTESIVFFSDEELLAAGATPDVLRDPNYVKARGVLGDVELFDAAFFGFSPREAELMDPQHRLFLEYAWEALERAGYAPAAGQQTIGVYAGVGMNSYLLFNLYPHRHLVESVGFYQAMLGNDKDFLPTRVSYKLNLLGPSISVNTACSTSLVAVHLACQALLNGECDMALAGGVRILLPQISGYLYQAGAIHSPDGHCRAFDAQAQGTVSGSAVGIVVLKRLADALADGDRILAVVRGSAVNNDGAAKVGYTAPSVDGQARVIAEAQTIAEAPAETITYVETHGTGTPLGDPIEIEALTKVFRASTDKKGFCAIGSVKTNIGHTDSAAGAAGLIKTVLALQHRQIPPSLHFRSPNPNIDFANSPFYVNTQLKDWRPGRYPCRAGVSSFGIGGTNAHVVLEQAPRVLASGPSRGRQLLLLSAKTMAALDRATANMATHLAAHPEQNLADVAYTLQVGRQGFSHRRMLVCRERAEAAEALATLDPTRLFTRVQEDAERTVIFLFPGQGAQYVGMAAGLYASEPTFRADVDACAELLLPHLGIDLRAVIFGEGRTAGEGDEDKETRRQGDKESVDHLVTLSPGHLVSGDAPASAPGPEAAVGELLAQTRYTQPALFVIEYALARLYMRWGVRPEVMIGHSIGEFVAACLADVLSLEDALRLVAMRGALMQALPAGAMLAVTLPEAEIAPLLGPDLALAAVNAPGLCVVSGPIEPIEELERALRARGSRCRRLRTSHAFHSAMMEPIVAPFVEELRRCRLRPPRQRYLSNVTGAWITAEEATDPGYWGRHLRAPVRFAEGLEAAINQKPAILLEVGPGRTLSTLARQQGRAAEDAVIVASLRHPAEAGDDEATLLAALGQLWLAGAPIDWAGFYAEERRQRVLLPTYPFERQRYWIDAQQPGRPLPSAVEADDARPLDAIHPRPGLTTAYVAPGDEIQELLVDLWQALLGIKRIGIHDNFFELGGHSLLATQLMSQIRVAFQVELSVRTIFEAPTIARLSEAIAQGLSQQIGSATLIEMLSEIKQLSQDDIQAMLAAEQALAEDEPSDE